MGKDEKRIDSADKEEKIRRIKFRSENVGLQIFPSQLVYCILS